METKKYEAVRLVRHGDIHYSVFHCDEYGWGVNITWPSFNTRYSTLGFLSYAELKALESVGMQNHWPVELLEILREAIDKSLEVVLKRLDARKENVKRVYNVYQGSCSCIG